jgi:hypothetical protein
VQGGCKKPVGLGLELFTRINKIGHTVLVRFEIKIFPYINIIGISIISVACNESDNIPKQHFDFILCWHDCFGAQ